ncbi:MAG: glycosyltransferase family 2 protein [Nanobdellota archaeon]
MTKDKRRSVIRVIWAMLFVIFLILVILLKIVAFEGMNVIHVYTLGITVFMLTRVVGSFFYKNYRTRLDEKQKEKIRNYFPSVSFVIPCKNEEKAIYNTIASCASSKYPRNKIEIVAINDGSTDNTLKEMQRAKRDFPEVKIKIADFKQNKGKREGMYYGFKNSTGEIVIQVDSDSQPAPDALKEIVIPFLDKKVGATVGHTDPSNKDDNLITKMQTAYYFMSFRTLKATESIFDMVFCCSGCFSAYRRTYVMPILDKWLNEKFMGKAIIFGDDRALTNWIIRQGYKTVYVADAKAVTVVPNKLKQFLKQQTRWKKGWLINSIRIAPEVLKKDKFVALTYFIPLIILTILTPIIAFKAMIINPLFLGISPLFYIAGILLVSTMLYMQYNMYSRERYGRYMLLWSILNMTILSYILVYAIYDLRNMKWGTR